MENKVRAIVKKVQEMYRFDGRFDKMFATEPIITLKLSKDGEFHIDCIHWISYTALYVRESCIEVHPEKGPCAILITYESWDALLNL